MTCEEILTLKMAELDGEQIPSPEVERHLMTCEDCRREVAAMQDLDTLFRSQQRADVDISVWPQIHDRISTPARVVGWRPFAIVGVALVVYKIVELSLRNDPGLLIALVPIAFAAVLFILLRENPFKVNTELIMEK